MASERLSRRDEGPNQGGHRGRYCGRGGTVASDRPPDGLLRSHPDRGLPCGSSWRAACGSLASIGAQTPSATAAFMSIAAYISAIPRKNFDLSPWLTMPTGRPGYHRRRVPAWLSLHEGAGSTSRC